MTTASALAEDARFMRRALELAARGRGTTWPNPLVGSVVVRDGEIVGEGWHARYGGPHAEIMALDAAGAAARGSTVYVTLEPCAHHGKTSPCTEALLRAGVARVVVGARDPNPVAAGGASMLQQQGIAVTMGVEERASHDVNAPFFGVLQHPERPFVTLKLALSIDGAIVGADRARGWLTGAEARREVHRMRAEVDGIAVGIGTALADDPALTVREVARTGPAPRRVVFDRHARLPLASALARTAHEVPVEVVTAPLAQDPSGAERVAALEACGVTVTAAPDLPTALQHLRASGIRHLLVEGGATVASALMEAGLVDRLVIFQAPVLLGAGALAAFAALPARSAADAVRLRVVSREAIGADFMTTYAVSGD